MPDKKNTKTKPQSRTAARLLKWFLAIVAFLVVLTFLFVPVFISSQKGRQIILTKINSAIAGRTNFAKLSMGWFKGIKITDFSFNDDAGQTSIQVEQIATKPHYGSILTGSLSFGQTVIDKPKIQINLKQRQPAKPTRRAGAPSQQVTPPPQEPKPAIPVIPPVKQIDLVVNDGNLKVTDRQEKTVELSQINSRLNLRPPGRKTNFDISMAVVDNTKHSQVHAAGQITPAKTKTGWTLKGTTGDLIIEVNDLDLETLAPLFSLAELDVQAKGVISADIKSEIKDGSLQRLTADIKAKDLDVTVTQLKGDRLKTNNLDVAIQLASQKEFIKIDKLQLKSDWAMVNATGTIPTTIKSFAQFVEPTTPYSLKADFEYDLPAIFSQMPRTLGLKEGMQITSGRLTGNIEKIAEAGKQKIQGQATLSDLQGTMEGKKIALSQPIQAQMQISPDKTGIKFDELNVQSSFAKVNCSGSTELLNYNTDIDLKKFQSELGQFVDIGPYQVAGQLSGKGQLSIKEDKITTIGSSAIKNLSLTKEQITASEPSANIDFNLGIDQKNNLINIGSLKANATLGQLNIKDAALPLNQKTTKPWNLPISAGNINLQKLQPFLVLFASFPKEMQLAGTANSDTSISYDKNIYKITTDSTKIKNLKVIYPEQKPFESNDVFVIFDAEINTEQKTINLKKLQLDSPQIKIKKGQIQQSTSAGKTKLQGQFDCEYDWSALSTLTAPYLPQGLQLQGKRKDNIIFTSEYPTGEPNKLIANLNTKAKLGFEKAYYMGLLAEPTELDIQIQNGLLNIAPFSTTVNKGQFNFAAQADFKKKPAILKTPGPLQIVKDIQINTETTKNLLMYLNPIFANAVNVTGVANLNCDKLAIPLTKNDRNSLEVIGTISINKLRLQASDLLGQIISVVGVEPGVDMTIHPTKFFVQNGFIRYDDMQLDVGNKPVNFKGTIGLDKTLNMTVTLPYTIEGKTARIDKQTPGARITLPLKGTLDRPKLDLGRLLQEQLKKQLEEQLRKGLEELFK